MLLKIHGPGQWGGPWTGSMGWSMGPGLCFAYVPADVSSPFVVAFVAGSLPSSIISLTSSNKEIHQADSPPPEVLFSWVAISNFFKVVGYSFQYFPRLTV